MSTNVQNHSVPTSEELASLFVNNADLDRVRAHLGRFNPIKTMRMERMEIRHSAILAWLLNPQESHGLGDNFLKAFLSGALRGYSGDSKPSALEVSQADMMDAEIRREWRGIDILILSLRNGWAFIVENKYHSTQHGNQLARYLEVAEDVFAAQCVRGIFLTLRSEEPADDRYAPFDYASICDLLKQHALSGRYPLAAEVEIFLRHYLEIIEEETGMNEEIAEMEKLAGKLYRDNRRALDFIMEHGKATDFSFACDSVFGEDRKYPQKIEIDETSFVFHKSDARGASFLPQTWFEALGSGNLRWRGCESWWAGFPLVMWVRLSPHAERSGGRVWLYAEVGPLENHNFRSELIEAISNVKGSKKIKFQRGAGDAGKKFSKFFNKNSFPIKDVHDHEEISSAIKKAIYSFQSEIEAVAKVLPGFVQKYTEDGDASGQ